VSPQWASSQKLRKALHGHRHQENMPLHQDGWGQ
jgi:hypothetical protein